MASVAVLSELVADAATRDSSGLRFRRVLELQEDEEDDTELSCLSEFRTKLLQGSGRAVLVEDRGACHEKRVLKVRSAQATLVHATTPPQLARNPTQARSLYGALAALHRHPHVCRVHQLVPVGDDHDDALVVVLQQFASHGSLRAMLSYLPAGALTETNARLLFQQLVMAVDYLTRKGITEFMITLDTCFLHRDGSFPPRSAHRLAITSQPTTDSPMHHRSTQTRHSGDQWRTLELELETSHRTTDNRRRQPQPRHPGTHQSDDLTGSDVRLLLDPRPLTDPHAPAESLLRHPALYSPPEVLRGGSMCEAGLVWMLGVVLHCMLTGSFPFVQAATWAAAMRGPAERVGAMFAADLLQQPLASGALWAHLSPGAAALLGALLQRDPARRPALGMLFRDHPWVAEGAPFGALRFNDSLLSMESH